MTTHLPRRPALHRLPVRASAALVAVAALGLAACGDDDPDSTSAPPPGDTTTREDGPRTIEVEMVDNAFEPAELAVDEGETVRLVFTNKGAVAHDAVIGDQTEQDEHEAEMRAAEEGGMGGMSHDSMDGSTASSTGDMAHDSTGGSTASSTGGEGAEAAGEEPAVTVEPGETAELTHTFAHSGQILIGCHQPGHYEAGMKAVVAITTV